MSAQESNLDGDVGSWVSSRELLRHLRTIMRDTGATQDRLDMVVRLIADHMSAEVCSIYVMQPGAILELRATKGLKPEAVRRTSLKVGEGLVGDVAANARPLALAEAQTHPKFAYRPETGEEVYHSLLAVPLLHGSRVRGVLVVQNEQPRSYSEADVEICETVAMVLAELIDRIIATEPNLGPDSSQPTRLVGMPLNQGLAIGTAVFHQRGLVISQIVAEDPQREIARFHKALIEVESTMSERLSEAGPNDTRESQEILETYLMLVEDRGWRNRIEGTIKSGLTAEAAVQKVQNDMRARMLSIKDRYLRERLSDLEDVASRLLSHLVGRLPEDSAIEPPEDAIVIARNLGPAELLDYDRKRIRAVVLAEGSPMAHATIVARALDIPMIGRCPGAVTQIFDGDSVIVDGNMGLVLVRPTDAVRGEFVRSVAARARQEAIIKANRDLPAETRDGVRIQLGANAGLLIDLPHVEDNGADGIGLYRTEVAFMVRDHLPDVEDQALLYATVLDKLGDKPVVFRTLDLGGDKILPALQLEEDEENPAMGWRAIRIGLDRPEMLRVQLRAMIQAAAGQQLKIVFPMVSEVAEFDAARAILDRELEDWLRGGEAAPRDLQVGAMLEVPALLWQLPPLLQRVDFLSVGSNDLFQFLFASDRGNPKVSDRYDSLAPAALSLLRDLATRAERASVPLTLCGEMAGDPLGAMAVIGCGIRNLSMAPTKVPAVKAMVRSLDLDSCMERLSDISDSAAHSLRDELRRYAKENGVEIGA